MGFSLGDSREPQLHSDRRTSTLDPVDLTVPHGYKADHTLGANGIFVDDEFSTSPRAPTLGSRQASTVTSKELRSHDKLNEQEKSEEEHNPSMWSRIANNTWTFEAITMAFSLACMAAIIIVLYLYDGEELRVMPWGLTLNAIISALATGAETALIAVIASTLSQLKWDWFKSHRTLDELQVFDNASRGAVGAFQLITQPTSVIAIVGAALTIFALVFDPLVQQIIRYPILTTNSTGGQALTRSASTFDPHLMGIDLPSAINAGIWGEASQFSRAPHCTSGNCIWPEFDSLGWCSKCENVTALATFSPSCDNILTTKSNSTCELSLGSGASTMAATVRTSSKGGLTLAVNYQTVWRTHLISVGGDSDSQKTTVDGIHAPALILGFAQLSALDSNSSKLHVENAEQCALTPCTRRYSIRTSNGSIETKVMSTNYGVVLPKTLSVEGGHEPVTCWQPDSRDVSYSFVGQQYVNQGELVFFWANKSVSAFCPVQQYSEQIASSFTGGQNENWILEDGAVNGYYPLHYTSGTAHRVGAHILSYITNNVAEALTALALAGSNDTIIGSVKVSKSHVLVRWSWLIYPIILELMGLTIFILTVIQTRSHNTYLWRSSLLPLLFHMSMEHWSNEFPAPMDNAGMTARARKLRARLRLDDDDHALRID